MITIRGKDSTAVRMAQEQVILRGIEGGGRKAMIGHSQGAAVAGMLAVSTS